MAAGDITRNKTTGQLSVVEKNGVRTPFDTIEAARTYRSQKFPEPARTFQPESQRELGATFGREFKGGLKQVGAGIVRATVPPGLPRPFGVESPTLANAFDIPLGALRVAGALPAELGVQTGRAIETIGPRLGLSEGVSRKAGQVGNLATQLIPTPGKNIPGLTKDFIKNMRPFVRAILRKEPSGGLFRQMTQRGARKFQQGPGLPEDIEQSFDFVTKGGTALRKAERDLSSQVSQTIQTNMGKIPDDLLRPSTTIRRSTEEALEILGTRAKQGKFVTPSEAKTRAVQRFVTPKPPKIPEPSGLLDARGNPILPDIPPEVLETLQSGRPLSIQTMDELRKVVGSAIGRAREVGDRRTVKALGKVLFGIKRDMVRFADEFPEEVRGIAKAFETFKTRVIPLREFSGLQPSQITKKLFRAAPEEIRDIVRALPLDARKQVGDSVFEGVIQQSWNPESGLFEPNKFVKLLTPDRMQRLREFYPDRFTELKQFRAKLIKVVPGVMELERKGKMTRAFGLARLFRGVMEGSFSQIKGGAMTTLAPTIFSKIAQTRGGLKLLGDIAIAPVQGARAAELTRKLFSVTNAAILELEREGVEIPEQLRRLSPAQQNPSEAAPPLLPPTQPLPQLGPGEI